MELDEPIKYIVWIVLFLIAMGGIYLLFKSFGMI